MRNTMMQILLAGMLLITASCGASNRSDEVHSASEAPPAFQPPAESSAEHPEDATTAPDIGQRLGSAVQDAYADIEIDAFIRERKAILPGFAIPVTVTVKNSGEETVDYIHGSGSYATPEALFIHADSLQTVLPEDHLGPTTMDFRTEELKPGGRLEFVMYVMAIEPHANFNTYTIEMYYDNGEYIAGKEWDGLRQEFPDLTPAEPGSYQGQAYFLYYTRNGSGVSDFTTEPTGYAEYDFRITIS